MLSWVVTLRFHPVITSAHAASLISFISFKSFTSFPLRTLFRDGRSITPLESNRSALFLSPWGVYPPISPQKRNEHDARNL
jgi:hypothetical protein